MRGYDNYGVNHQILVDIPMNEQIGVMVAGETAHDLSKAHHTFTLTGGLTWTALPSGLVYLVFDGATGYLQCPAADSVDLNFTVEDFTIVAWINNALLGGAQIIINQGAVDVDGWEFFLFGTTLSLRTNQAAAHTDISAVAALTASIWQLVGVTRHGATGQFFVNGLAVTTTLGAGLTDAVSCAGGNKLLIGVQNNEATNLFDGSMSRPRVWNRALSMSQMAEIFQNERHWYGV